VGKGGVIESFDYRRWAEGNLFLRCRAERLGPAMLAERSARATADAPSGAPSGTPTEALLQQAWLHQRLVAERLRALDGRPVRVLHPGFLNREPGPDFRGSIVQIGGDAPVAGDIEIDLAPAGWRQHAHAGNPAYRGVVLHVTWQSGPLQSGLPTLPLEHALDSTVPELEFWLGLEPRPLPEGLAGECAAPLRALDPALLRAVLRQAAQARLCAKAAAFQARARQTGWEGALWEGLFAALGYKRNEWPMRRLAGLRAELIANLPAGPSGFAALQGRLLGVAGLLPSELGKNAAGYLRAVWDQWWRDADGFREFILPAGIWALGGIRPANHPQRRLAVAAHWLRRADFIPAVTGWIERRIESPDLLRSLAEILQPPDDEFWSHHYTLRSARFSAPQALLGGQRVTDLAMNVILPWLHVRACAGRSAALAREVEARYFLWPAGEDNARLKLARQRLFGGVPAHFLATAAQQQGVLQITRDFCAHSNAACESCPFPDLLRTMPADGAESSAP